MGSLCGRFASLGSRPGRRSDHGRGRGAPCAAAARNVWPTTASSDRVSQPDKTMQAHSQIRSKAQESCLETCRCARLNLPRACVVSVGSPSAVRVPRDDPASLLVLWRGLLGPCVLPEWVTFFAVSATVGKHSGAELGQQREHCREHQGTDGEQRRQAKTP